MKTRRPLSREALYIVQALACYLFYWFHRLLPLDVASRFGAEVAKCFGRYTKANHHAAINLKIAFPDMSDEERAAMLPQIWDNIGRTVAELPFIANGGMERRIQVQGAEHLARLKSEGRNAIFVSAHLGNWEILPKVARDYGFPLMLIYRRANNEWLNRLLCRVRAPIYKAMYPKGAKGATMLVRALREGTSAAILVDQKMNSGISVPFFGRPSMTASAVAELSLKMGVPLVLARCERGEGANFSVEISEPLYFTPTDNRERDVMEAMTRLNATLENWIRRNPAQWFWVHRRWDKRLYNS